MQLFVDHLTVIDCSYLHPDYGIEGESWIVDVALEGDLDDQSMIMDFGPLKKRLKAAIDATVDHALLVPLQSAHLEELQVQSGATKLHWNDVQGRRWEHCSPEGAICTIDTSAIDIHSVTAYLREQLQDEMPRSVKRLRISLRPERIDGPYYHYSHGLRKHDGNCQRIAHGHRSRLEIWRNGELAESEMHSWCERWKHSYLVSQDDITQHNTERLISEYTAPQGYFRLDVPAQACYVLPYETTVERIAQHIAETLHIHQSTADWCVKAYEGVQKGAIIDMPRG